MTQSLIKRYWQGGKFKPAEPVYALPKHKVDFKRNPHDQLVKILGSVGWSTDAIARAAKLSHGQVNYRLKAGSIKRSDYRSGKSVMAQFMLNKAAQSAALVLDQPPVRKLKAPR